MLKSRWQLLPPSLRLLGLLVILLAMPVLAADEPPAEAPAEPVELAQVVPGAEPLTAATITQTISLDLRGMDVLDAIKYLAVKGNLNVVTTKSVSGSVSLFLKNVTIADALDIILLTNDLALETRGDIHTVMAETEYEALHGYRYHDQRQVKTVALKYANSPRVATLLEGIKSSIGRIIADEGTGTLVLVDVPDRLEKMTAALGMLDLETVIRPAATVSEVFALQYNNVKDLKETITAALTPTIGALRADEKTNTLVINDLAHRMPEFRQMIAAFDRKTRQVFIEAKVLQLTLSDEFDVGVEWTEIFKDPWINRLTLATSFPSSVTSFGRLAIGTIGTDHLGATIKALQRFGKTDVLSTPHIAALEGQEASIHIGTKEVYVTSTTSTGSSTSSTSEAVNFIDVGIKLNVTPSITEDGMVTMKIKPEVSSVSRSVTTAQGNSVPVVDTSVAETSVMVQDGTTIVMGGLIKDRIALITNQVPLLGSLPLIGALFRFKDNERIKTELIVFLTPHVITGEHPVGPPTAMKPPKPFKEFAE
ncbi:MAG: hypothetical protein A3C53_02780 [Omnitrophica WOR_2 bacterium RIFCSPHIGHO2_02_FULL_68_15]|nr:MAG: hypothetical protein A3C53_02780 [Omnitrophica WOR_2 bacterium RIFCSPHIGHO2_02_FULL_68_15]